MDKMMAQTDSLPITCLSSSPQTTNNDKQIDCRHNDDDIDEWLPKIRYIIALIK
jgi:hypothetical protein